MKKAENCSRYVSHSGKGGRLAVSIQLKRKHKQCLERKFWLRSIWFRNWIFKGVSFRFRELFILIRYFVYLRKECVKPLIYKLECFCLAPLIRQHRKTKGSLQRRYIKRMWMVESWQRVHKENEKWMILTKIVFKKLGILNKCYKYNDVIFSRIILGFYRVIMENESTLYVPIFSITY